MTIFEPLALSCASALATVLPATSSRRGFPGTIMSDADQRRADVFDFTAAAPALRGTRAQEIAAHFDIDAATASAHRQQRSARCPIAPPSTGELMLVAGASGSGKTSLLRAMRRPAKRAGIAIIDLRRIALPDRPVVELFEHDPTLARTLKRLASVGLAEVWTWLRPPSQLSEGQRWRLRLALAIAQVERSPSPVLLVCDEFAAVLDRVSACIVSGVLRRAIDAHRDRLAALVATSHDDLHDALSADVIIECDFGRITVTRKDGVR